MVIHLAPSKASPLRDNSRQLETRQAGLRAQAGQLDEETRAHRDQMKALQSHGRKLQKGKNKALPYLLASFGTAVVGLVGGGLANQPILMGIGLVGMLGTVIGAAFVEASQDHLEEMGEKFSQHQQETLALDGQRTEVERALLSTEESLAGNRQLEAMTGASGPSALAEKGDGVTVGGVFVRKR